MELNDEGHISSGVIDLSESGVVHLSRIKFGIKGLEELKKANASVGIRELDNLSIKGDKDSEKDKEDSVVEDSPKRSKDEEPSTLDSAIDFSSKGGRPWGEEEKEDSIFGDSPEYMEWSKEDDSEPFTLDSVLDFSKSRRRKFEEDLAAFEKMAQDPELQIGHPASFSKLPLSSCSAPTKGLELDLGHPASFSSLTPTKSLAHNFKRPFSPTSSAYPAPNKKRKVLAEDKFADALEKIIQRECFPELEKLKAQNAYLDAVANNDLQMMRELHNRYGSIGRTPSMVDANETPTTFETPSSVFSSKRKGPASITPLLPQEGESEPARCDDAKSVISETTSYFSSQTGKKKPHHMSLNEFLNTYTSEDNHSFQEIIDEGIRKHKIKYAWLYGQEDEHNKKQQQAMMLPSAEQQQSLDFQRPNQVETWTYKNRNAVMYIPDGASYTGTELADMAKNKNEVEFKNTRFTGKPYKPKGEKVQEPPTPSGKALNLIRGITEGKIGVDGKEENLKTPSVNGFKYVRTPSPAPGVQETPFLTWGEIEGTPFRLDASDTPVPSSVGTPYRMIETSRRERLALELADKVSQRHRDKKQKTIEVAKSYLTTPSPRPTTSGQRMSMMSPAAQRFAKNLLKRSDTGTPRSDSTPR